MGLNSTVAGSDDGRVAGACAVVYDDSAVAIQAQLFGEFSARFDPDTDDDEICRNDRPVGQFHAGDLLVGPMQSHNTGSEDDVDAALLVGFLVEVRDRRGSDPLKEPVKGLNDSDGKTSLTGHRGSLEPDESA